jgi:hypothetical protein
MKQQIKCLFLLLLPSADGYTYTRRPRWYSAPIRLNSQPLFASPYDDVDDSNKWVSSNFIPDEQSIQSWDQPLPPTDDDNQTSGYSTPATSPSSNIEEDDGQTWIDTISQIAAEEITFINTEVDRADKLRLMQEWGFSKDTIAATLDVATDASREIDPTNQLLSIFQDVTKKTGFGMVVKDVDDVDPKSVESHTTIERDEDTGEPIRSQMVYVDEHTCIGCTNCAMIAQSTFFMEESLGRAR